MRTFSRAVYICCKYQEHPRKLKNIQDKLVASTGRCLEELDTSCQLDEEIRDMLPKTSGVCEDDIEALCTKNDKNQDQEVEAGWSSKVQLTIHGIRGELITCDL